jgi:hypothetical protein
MYLSPKGLRYFFIRNPLLILLYRFLLLNGVAVMMETMKCNLRLHYMGRLLVARKLWLLHFCCIVFFYLAALSQCSPETQGCAINRLLAGVQCTPLQWFDKINCVGDGVYDVPKTKVISNQTGRGTRPLRYNYFHIL